MSVSSFKRIQLIPNRFNAASVSNTNWIWESNFEATETAGGHKKFSPPKNLIHIERVTLCKRNLATVKQEMIS